MTNKLHYLIITILIGFATITGYSQTDTVVMESVDFVPGILEVEVGTEVVWINNSSTVHTSESGEDCTNDGIWDSGDIPAGETYSRVFDTEGSFPYFCEYHCLAGMTGYIDVGTPFGIEELEDSGISIGFLGPIPSEGKVYLDLEIAESSNLNIVVYDLKGIEALNVIDNSHLNPGQHRITIRGDELDPGIYLCRIVSDDISVTRKISIR